MALYTDREQHCTVLCGRSVLNVSSWWSRLWLLLLLKDAVDAVDLTTSSWTPSTMDTLWWTYIASQLASLDTDQPRLYQLPPTSCRLRRRSSWGSDIDDLLSLTAAFQGRPTLRSLSHIIITYLLFVPFVGFLTLSSSHFIFYFRWLSWYIRVELVVQCKWVMNVI